ncbi:hypothetical protein [Pyruvatibacter sp.]|uniref:hypothetical protein n=1 Tax=Pyruvatibacter sp. TaxID=1981328 RepID=UPI0032EEBB2F
MTLTEYDLVQTWIPASMIAVLMLLILLDSMWLSRKSRKEMARSGGDGGPSTGGGGGGGRDSEAKWHEQNKSDFAARQWHEKNREILRNKQGTAAQAVGAAPTAAFAMGASNQPSAKAGGYWGPWIVLTSLILGAGLAFYAIFPLTQQ